MKRLICFLLALVLMLQLAPVLSGSARAEGLPIEQTESAVSDSVISNAAAELRAQLVKHAESHTIRIPTDHAYSDAEERRALSYAIVDKALEHTGNPKEGDALRLNVSHWGFKYLIGSSYLDITFSMTYYTTPEQESELDSLVAQLLSDLKISSKTDRQRFYAIYDYICKNITYDHANLNDTSYQLKYSAYAALKNKTAVCQGYTALLYRLLLEAGIDNRAITGQGNGTGEWENHAWNIVKMGRYYYNVDSTWDAVYVQAKQNGIYTLRCNDNFIDHIRDAEYNTTSFNTSYPMGPTDYCPFVDVRGVDFFFDPVVWAVQERVTNGLSDTTFGPYQTCTRGQVVTFLWRARGCPSPMSLSNPFTDVSTTDYFYQPVLWAYTSGVTEGVSKTNFGPKQSCTRAQVVTFMWRARSKPTVSGSNPFTDVAPGAYYYDAVLWAVSQEITNGTSAMTFSPNQTCTRGQIVTFLYRDYGPNG